MPSGFDSGFDSGFGATGWELFDFTLNWLGEYDATYGYNQYDTVLYKTPGASEWHAFTSKTSHNVGNTPTTSPAYWRRVYQEQFV